jgi:hypothetical protein
MNRQASPIILTGLALLISALSGRNGLRVQAAPGGTP